MKITTPVLKIVDSIGNMTANFKTWSQLVTNMSMIEGSGNPENVVSAMRTRQYMDITGSVGARVYIKTVDSVAGNDKQGWELV
jgi:hypothetical protein